MSDSDEPILIEADESKLQCQRRVASGEHTGGITIPTFKREKLSNMPFPAFKRIRLDLLPEGSAFDIVALISALLWKKILQHCQKGAQGDDKNNQATVIEKRLC